MFNNKTILITGGTGSLGKVLLKRLLTGEKGPFKKIILFSRDEDKHTQINLSLNKLYSQNKDLFIGPIVDLVDFRIGDVRDYDALFNAVKDSDIIINAAAMKQVPPCEYFPFEAVKTNIIGTENLIKAVNTYGSIDTVIGISTDKACKPVNTYGMTKAIQERLILAAGLNNNLTKFICVRYGNVMGSRGSVIPLFYNQINNGGPVTITTVEMTRFLLSLNEAVDTIFDAFKYGQTGQIFVPTVKSAIVTDIANVMIETSGIKNISIEYVGIRPGEKTHEILISEEESGRTVKQDKYFIINSIFPENYQNTANGITLYGEYCSKDFTVDQKELYTMLQKDGHLDF